MTSESHDLRRAFKKKLKPPHKLVVNVFEWLELQQIDGVFTLSHLIGGEIDGGCVDDMNKSKATTKYLSISFSDSLITENETNEI